MSSQTPILATILTYENMFEPDNHLEDVTNKIKDEVLKVGNTDFKFIPKELEQVSRWGKKLNSSKKLEFARIRPIKWYMWALSIIPWPSMFEERIELAKVASFVYIIDDIFDVHGTLDELSLFVEVINRWKGGDIDKLPEYMQVCLRSLYDFVDEFSHKISENTKWNPKYSLIKVWINLCNSFLVEAKWFAVEKLPSAEEYLNNGIISSSAHMGLMHVFFLLGEVNQKSINEMNNLPSIVYSTAMIVRLSNDIGTDQNTNRAENDGSYIDCLKEEDSEKWTTESARLHVNEMVSNAWKTLNQECSFSSFFSTKFKTSCVNFARMSVIMYNHDVAIHRQSLEKYLRQCLMNVQNDE